MAWEWVAPAATAASGIVGVGFTWYAGHQGRKHAERVADKAANSQLMLAREARKAEAYVETYKMITRVTLVQVSDPDHVTDLGIPVLDREVWVTPLLDGMAKITMYGSLEVQQLHGKWLDHVSKLATHNIKLLLGRENNSAKVSLTEEERAAELKAFGETTRQLREQMNRELTS